jgi:hypothetical protein
MNYFITDGRSIRALGHFKDHEEGLKWYKLLNDIFDNSKWDLVYVGNDHTCSGFDNPQQIWVAMDYNTFLGSIGLPTPEKDDIREHPAMIAALEHISTLEEQLDTIDREQDNLSREISSSIERAIDDAMSSSNIDASYSAFDLDEHLEE